MASFHQSLTLPYPPQQLFALVADIERYPCFLPHVAAARITRREDNRLWVEQLVRLPPLRFCFHTEATLTPYSDIAVICAESPFGTFDQHWHFDALEDGRSRIDSQVVYRPGGGLVAAALRMIERDMITGSLTAFERRAQALYGGAPPQAAQLAGDSVSRA